MIIPGGGTSILVDHSRKCADFCLQPHPLWPNYYYVCGETGTILATCNESKIFDKGINMCIVDMQQMIEDFNTSGALKKYNHVDLPTCEAPGRFPVSDSNCTAFYTCIFNGFRWCQEIHNCPPSTHYDPLKKECGKYTCPITYAGESDKSPPVASSSACPTSSRASSVSTQESNKEVTTPKVVGSCTHISPNATTTVKPSTTDKNHCQESTTSPPVTATSSSLCPNSIQLSVAPLITIQEFKEVITSPKVPVTCRTSNKNTTVKPSTDKKHIAGSTTSPSVPVTSASACPNSTEPTEASSVSIQQPNEVKTTRKVPVTCITPNETTRVKPSTNKNNCSESTTSLPVPVTSASSCPNSTEPTKASSVLTQKSNEVKTTPKVPVACITPNETTTVKPSTDKNNCPQSTTSPVVPVTSASPRSNSTKQTKVSSVSTQKSSEVKTTPKVPVDSTTPNKTTTVKPSTNENHFPESTTSPPVSVTSASSCSNCTEPTEASSALIQKSNEVKTTPKISIGSITLNETTTVKPTTDKNRCPKSMTSPPVPVPSASSYPNSTKPTEALLA